MDREGRTSYYKGVKFRSRTESEAAWWFTVAELPWKYEPTQIRIDAHEYYTPDFIVQVPEMGDVIVEVKPTLGLLYQEAMLKLMKLATVVDNAILGRVMVWDEDAFPTPNDYRLDAGRQWDPFVKMNIQWGGHWYESDLKHERTKYNG
jgi:hypothetical protein